MQNAKPYLVSRESYLVKKTEIRSQHSEVRRLLADGIWKIGVCGNNIKRNKT